MVTIENQQIYLGDKYNGKYIHELTAAEVLAMEAEFRKKQNIKRFEYVAGGTGIEVCKDIHVTMDNSKGIHVLGLSKPKKKHWCSININGHHYDSFEDMIEGEKDAPNVIQNVTHLADGTTIVQKNGKTYINGEEQETGKNPVYIIVCGDVKEINTQMADVEVIGNVGSVKTASGDIKATTIECSCSTMSGDVRAEKILGSASTMSGDIFKN